MREIKFRAWSKKNTEMLHPDDVAVMPINDGVSPLSISGEAIRIRPDNDQFVLMQYTGLKDKNGVEIYEGDIVKYRAKKVEHDAVFYEGSSFKLCQQSRRTTRTLDHHMDKWQVTVIGNIYENPELLEANQ